MVVLPFDQFYGRRQPCSPRCHVVHGVVAWGVAPSEVKVKWSDGVVVVAYTGHLQGVIVVGLVFGVYGAEQAWLVV